MSRRGSLILVGLAGCVAGLLLAPTGKALAQQVSQVLVVNWPSVQTVRGDVTLAQPVHLAEEQSFLEIVVPPVKRSETTRIVEAGQLVTDGFPSVVLSLHGETRGEVQKPGSVGVILLPAEESIGEAFNERGRLDFVLETVADGIDARTPYFASKQPRYTVAFKSYRVLLYNTTDKTVTANVYAYLTQ